DLEHRRADVDAGQGDAGRVDGEVKRGADGHFERLPRSLRADPVPVVAEQDPVEKPHLLVVRGRVPVPVAPPPVTLARLSGHRQFTFFPDRRPCPAGEWGWSARPLGSVLLTSLRSWSQDAAHIWVSAAAGGSSGALPAPLRHSGLPVSRARPG